LAAQKFIAIHGFQVSVFYHLNPVLLTAVFDFMSLPSFISAHWRNRRLPYREMNMYGSKAVIGRAIAQAISRWLPTAAARLRSRVWSSAICGGQSGAGEGFLRVLRFPLPIFIPPIAPQSPSPIIWGW
jgi:hypothetical protein